jgi:beta-lactamase regulating signal transducer with metallopeptidase domain
MPDLVTLSTPISNVLLGWFAETTLIVSALAVLAALAVRVRRLAPGPAARHALWLIVMFKLVIPPFVHWPWSLPSPVASVRARVEPASQPLAPIAVSFDLPDEGIVPAAEPSALIDRKVPEPSPWPDLTTWALPQNPGVWVVSAWLVGSISIALGQARRVWRFRRLLLESSPAPAWLLDEADRVGERLGVRVPNILVVPRLGTPLLWCLGRPSLLVPESLLKTLEAERWRAIVAHELAHLRRGDQWVRRLELAAGLVWWWNPLYWLARRRLDFEAELACDAWTVWVLPKDRVSYAESLIHICTTLSLAESPAPALGVAGSGRSFERRLTMILRDQVERRVSAPSLLAASLLAALALPSWTMAAPTRLDEPKPSAPATAFDPITRGIEYIIAEVNVDDDDDDKATEQQKEKKKAAEAKAKAALEKAKAAMEAKLRELEQKLGDDSDPAKKAKLEVRVRELKQKFGDDSDFAKKMEALGKEMEGKFGPNSEFVKKMEGLGKEMEKQFGPGSAFAKEMEEKFGKDSDFAKNIEKQFGPGSDFAKEIEKKFGPESEFIKDLEESVKKSIQGDAKAETRKPRVRVEVRAKAEAEKDKADAEKDKAAAEKAKADRANFEAYRNKYAEARAKAEADRARAAAEKAKVRAETRARTEVRTKAGAAPETRDRRIEVLESRINELKAELDRLKAEGKPDGEKDQESRR